ncbi:hypothetical protein L3073_16730 [Ancylomarina sp. DW003]|nr:hypothetical protein [Ancylomarina sp. DW003]MDE5423862.1 hypothetical protein [Ancylomarina sp. DW003]
MNTKKIYDENGVGATRVFYDDKVEKVNPILHYKAYEINKRAIIFKDLLQVQSPFLASKLDDSFYINRAKEDIVGFFEDMGKTPFHKNFIELLQTTKKKDQIKLLKGMSLNPNQLMALIMKAYKDHDYLYSKYSFENLPKGVEGKKLPKLIEHNKGTQIRKVGSTELKDGELKNVIEHRKVIVSHFFEKEDNWHCFFLTYNSIAGKENHNGGQPHFHYISSSFGISKEDFIESMRSGNYKSTSVHIDLLEYGNQPNK